MPNILDWIKDNPVSAGLIGAGVGGILGGIGGGGQTSGTQGYTGGIPQYTASRPLKADAFSTTTGQVDATTGAPVARRPGSMGRSYFAPVTYTRGANESVMGGQELQAMQDAYNKQQKDLQEAGLSLLTYMGTQTPATTTPTVAPKTTTAPSADTQQLIGNLANTGTLSVKQIADLYPAYTETEIAYELLNRGYLTPAQLVAQYPQYSEQQVLDTYRTMGGTKYASGGLASLNQKGYYLGGPTDGMADAIPAMINGKEPARLSDGEFVIPADVVSHLGNGNSDAGAKNLYAMMDKVRKARTGTTKQGRQINPNKYLLG